MENTCGALRQYSGTEHCDASPWSGGSEEDSEDGTGAEGHKPQTAEDDVRFSHRCFLATHIAACFDADAQPCFDAGTRARELRRSDERLGNGELEGTVQAGSREPLPPKTSRRTWH